MLLVSAVILRLLWSTERMHSERLTNAHKQYQVARRLLATNSPESAAELWELHWTATQEQFAEYTSESYSPRLQKLYFEQPYQLHERIEQIGGRANDELNAPVQNNVSTVLAGLNVVIDELERKRPPRSGILKLAALCILPALLFWVILYHVIAYLPMRRKAQQTADELNFKEDPVFIQLPK